MPTATPLVFNEFVNDLGTKVQNLNSDTIKCALTNTAPVATQTTWNVTDHPAPAAASGYSAGGATCTGVSYSESSGVGTLNIAGSIVFAASGGSIGPFRYLVFYNSTAADAALVWLDWGTSLTIEDTKNLTITIPTGLIKINKGA
jgi:hypothetical protein